jgi:predicted membrane GTPase involved in stress response
VRVPLKDSRALAGDVVTIAGIPDTIAVGDTLTSTNNHVIEPINTPPLAPQTLCMDFGANDGPLVGREGTHVASSKIRKLLMTETDNNVTFRVENQQPMLMMIMNARKIQTMLKKVSRSFIPENVKRLPTV